MSLEWLWNEVLERLKLQLSRPTFETWIKTASALELTDNCLVIQTPNPFARNWLQKYYIKTITEVVQAILGKSIEIQLIAAEGDNVYGGIQTQLSPAIAVTPPSVSSFERHRFRKTDLNPKYVFSRFVVGSNNRMAHAASLAVAEAPGREFNPLFLCGGVGLGKTHLMQAIAHFILDHKPNHKVVYVSSETFTNELINAIRDDNTVKFRDKYRNIDILLVDDIQFLADKERTQEEFFHTFNSLHEANKQLIISSDRPPKEIPTLEERLRSRFEWGLITDIQKPDLETRIAILRKKADLEDLEIPNEVIIYIANKIQSNIRELEGALVKVIAYSSLVNKEIDMDLAQEALKDLVTKNQESKEITIDLIKKVVANYYNIKLENMISKKRTQKIAFPRQIAMYLARELTDSSLPQIGEEFGGRDHTTVIHSYKKIEKKYEEERDFRNTIKNIKEKIKK